MSTAASTHHYDIQLSPSFLQNFFNSQSAIKKIEEDARTLNPQPFQKRCGFLPFELRAFALECASCAWRILSLILTCVCAEGLSRRCVVQALHAQAGAASLRMEKLFDSRYLCPSVNTYRKQDSGIYTRPSISSPLLGAHGFFNDKGLCRGMCDWFYSLYFLTKDSFGDPALHMRTLAQQFAQGAPPQAALLHLLNPDFQPAKRYLSIKAEDFKQLSTRGVTLRHIAEQIFTLPTGAFTLFSSNHQFNFIKASDNLCFLFDPNYGCFRVEECGTLETLLAFVLSSHDKNSQLLIEKVLPVI
ncbi:MAG TPA: hypothetical protein VGJ00_02625 [Rhabdochlamydiaceae bacterium]|jgi:hypothetical protein